jgi:DNA-binding SARP family transcriptional activator
MGGPTVRLAGPVAVLRDGAPGTGTAVCGRKARTLLALLAARGGGPVPVDTIVEVLWPAGAPGRPARAVATLVSRLRAALGPDAVQGGPHGYRLGRPPAIHVDVDEAARLVGECRSRGDPRLAAAAGRRACDLLGDGPALAGEPDAAWVRDVRSGHGALLRAARHATARALLDAADPVGAAGIAAAAVAADRFDETAHRLLMAAHRSAGEPARALAEFERLRAELAEELGVDPAPETRALHLAVLADAPPATARRAAVPTTRPLPGRSGEIAVLTRAWAGATAGEGGVVLVVGECGIGKTRLVAEVEAVVRATGGQVVGARCYRSERRMFLQPLVDGLGPVLAALPTARVRELAGPRAAALAGLFPDLADAVGPPAGPDPADVVVRRAYEAVAAALRGMAALRPTLLVLDDLHDAGPSTVEFLHFLTRHRGRSRLLVLATLRPEEGSAVWDALGGLVDRLDLGPLPPDAVAVLAAAAGQGARAAEVLRRTHGHTLLVVEELRGRASGERGVPEAVRAVVLARARRLGAGVEEVLRAGAALGGVVDPLVLAGVLGVAPHVAARRCQRAADAGLLVAAGRVYAFANELVHEVVAASTPPGVRAADQAAARRPARPREVAAHLRQS